MTLGELADRISEIRAGGRNDGNVDAVQVSVAVACFELPLEGVVVKRGKCVLCDGRSTAGWTRVHAWQNTPR